jgi:transcriptional regulator of acetoin/glycerol metabolism
VTAHRGLQIVLASPSPLSELVLSGQFPADLYYRLNIVVIAGG